MKQQVISNCTVWPIVIVGCVFDLLPKVFTCVFCLSSTNQTRFMCECERNCSTWTFSGGFRTWVKMSLVRTSGKDSDSVEFRQEVLKSKNPVQPF